MFPHKVRPIGQGNGPKVRENDNFLIEIEDPAEVNDYASIIPVT